MKTLWRLLFFGERPGVVNCRVWDRIAAGVILIFAFFMAMPYLARWGKPGPPYQPGLVELLSAQTVSWLAMLALVYMAWWWEYRWRRAERSKGAPLEGNHGLWLGLFGATIPWVFLLKLPPYFSDDIFRYIWEGHVWWANPFVNPPALSAFETVGSSVLQVVRERVNHPQLPAIYPPAVQFVFIGLANVVGASVLLFKVGIAALSFLGVVATYGWLKWRGSPAWPVFLLAFNPLVVAEVAMNGHFDLLLAGSMALFFWGWDASGAVQGKQRRWGIPLAAFGLGAAIMIKLLPVVLLPWIALKKHERITRGRALLIATGGFAVAAAIFGAYHLPLHFSSQRAEEIGIEQREGAIGSLETYGIRWRRNDFGFYALEYWAVQSGLVDWAARQTWEDAPNPELAYKLAGFSPMAPHSRQIAKRLLEIGLILVLGGLILWPRSIRPEAAALWLFGYVMLFSPVLYPWYLLLLFPMLIRIRLFSFYYLMAAFPWMYLANVPAYFSGEIGTTAAISIPENIAALWVFFPFWCLLAVELACRTLTSSPAATSKIDQSDA